MVYSHSSLDAFKECPRRFAYAYLEKPSIEKRQSIEAYMGTVCHKTVQQIYRDLLLSRRMSLEEALEFYESEWERNRPGHFWIVRERYTEENYRQTGSRLVKDFYEAHAPFEDGRTLGIEKRIEIQIGNGTRLVGFIDRLVDHGGGSLEIIDYKTSADLPPLSDLEKNWQLPLYHLGLRQMIPDIKEVTCSWYYLAHRKRLSLRRSEEDLDVLTRQVTDLVGEIESTQRFDPSPSALCSWCDYEPICPARKHLFAVARLAPEKISKEEGVRLVDAYMAAKREKDAKEAEIRELEERIFLYAQQYQASVLRGTWERVKIWTKEGTAKFVSREENPQAAEAITAILRKHGVWERFASVSTFQLSKAIDQGEIPPKVMDDLRPYLRWETVRRLYSGKL